MISKQLNLKQLIVSETIPFLTVLMEVSWIYSFLVWFSSMEFLHSSKPIFSYLASFIFVLSIVILYRKLINSKLSLVKTRTLILIWAILFLAALIRINVNSTFGIFDLDWFQYARYHLASIVTITIFGAYLTWRGTSIGQQSDSYDGIYRKFCIGMAGTVFCLLIYGFGGEASKLWSDIGIYSIVFFCSGILTLALTNLKNLGYSFSQGKGSTTVFIQRWTPLLLVLIAIILVISIIITGILFTDTAASMLHGLSSGLSWIFNILTYLLYPLVYIIYFLFYIANLIVTIFKNGELEEPDFSSALNAFNWDETEKEPITGIPSEIMLLLKIIGVSAIVFLIIFLLVRSMRRQYHKTIDTNVYEENENLFSWKGLRLDLSLFFSWLFGWMHRIKFTPKQFQGNRVTDGSKCDDDREYKNIREIYLRFLIQGHRMGLPRKQAETPYEYSRRVQRVLNIEIQEIDSLTGAYICERYGNTQSKPDKLNLVSRLWQTIKQKLSELPNR